MTGSVGKVIMVYGVRGIVDSSDTILMVKMDEYEGISFEVGVSEARLYLWLRNVNMDGGNVV